MVSSSVATPAGRSGRVATRGISAMHFTYTEFVHSLLTSHNHAVRNTEPTTP